MKTWEGEGWDEDGQKGYSLWSVGESGKDSLLTFSRSHIVA